jgi:hypothetical protein
MGERLFFIGGFDQNAGFERGTPERVRQLVKACFEATHDHAGYILSPSHHFFTAIRPVSGRLRRRRGSACINRQAQPGG